MMTDTFREYETAIAEMDLMKDQKPGDLPPDVYYALGLAGETGEMVEKIKKVYRDNGGVYTPELRMAILLELGDCLWYLTRLAGFLGFSLGRCAVENVLKLQSRKARGTQRGSGDNR